MEVVATAAVMAAVMVAVMAAAMVVAVMVVAVVVVEAEAHRVTSLLQIASCPLCTLPMVMTQHTVQSQSPAVIGRRTERPCWPARQSDRSDQLGCQLMSLKRSR